MTTVVCAIIIEDEKILITQRSEFMSLPFKWEFPGGKLEYHETHEECLKRELKEELNVEILVHQKLKENKHDYGDISITLIPYLAEIYSGNIILSEHNDFKFVSKDEILNFDFAEADIPILHQIIKRQL